MNKIMEDTLDNMPKPPQDDPFISTDEDDEEEKPTMKVTLLSGFLGAGKTTLLKKILRINNERCDDEKLKMAVIVNDMGEVNLDAEEIKASKVIQEDAEMVEMHNGCICCTLRGDLLKTVKSLCQEKQFDYLVIESTGISEPLPVAQTFAMDVDSMQPSSTDQNPSEEKLTVATDEKQSLFHYAKLDTLVTVVDAINMFDVLASVESLADKDNVSGMVGNSGTDEAEGGKFSEEERKEAMKRAMATDIDQIRKLLKSKNFDTSGTKEELAQRLIDAFEEQFGGEPEQQVDNRHIARLWLDQIEFANVIVVSKAAQFIEKEGKAKLNTIERLLKKLNPKAQIHLPELDKYEDLDVSKTLINTSLFDMAESQASLAWSQELEKEEHTPETEEYGISSMVFTSQDMPFHPERFAMVLRGFGNYGSLMKITSNSESDAAKDGTEEKVEEIDMPNEYHHDDVFRGVVRTKGQVWLANSPQFPIRFQTAGTQIQLAPSDQPFFAEIKKKIEEKEDDLDEFLSSFVDTEIKRLKENGKWTEKFGDRRSEMIFIGCGLDKEKIRTWLTQALVSEEETAEMGGVEKWKEMKDPFWDGKIPDFEIKV